MTTHDFPPWFAPSECSLHSFGCNEGSKDPDLQLLALYLVSSPLMDTRGEYALPQAALLAHLQMESERVEGLLEQLNARGFCRYDFKTERVVVPLVTQIYQKFFVKPSTALCKEMSGCLEYVR